MAIYIGLLVVVLLCCIVEATSTSLEFSKVRISTRKLTFGICFTYILLLGILRNELLGVDVANYKEYFTSWYTRYDYLYILKHFEQDNGYILLNKIVEHCGLDFYMFKCIEYIICFGLFSFIIYKKSKYPALSFLIYLALGFLGINFCLLRQAIAYAICFVSFQFLKQEKIVKFVALVLLATTFHKTAIFFILVYPLTKDIFKTYLILKKGLLVLAFIGFSAFIIPNLYQFYMNDYSQIAVQGEGISLLIVYMVILFIMSRIKKNENKEKSLNYEASFCSVYFQTGALFFSLFTRITNYYAMLFTIVIPELIEGSKNKKWYFLIFSGGFSLLYLYTLFADSCRIIPYMAN